MRAAGVLAAVVAIAVAAGAGTAIATQVDRLATETPGGVRTAPAERGLPERVTIPAIGVDARIVPVGLTKDGAMQTPDFGLAAWYRPGPRPGDTGPAVLLAHVDSRAHGPDVFARLHELKPGDQVTVHYHDAVTTFAVTATEQTAKTALPKEKIWRATKKPVLRLITCGGTYDRGAGGYLDNVIVYADRLA
jgi:LPXTG-site transpeptidase (sortase) family protein